MVKSEIPSQNNVTADIAVFFKIDNGKKIFRDDYLY